MLDLIEDMTQRFEDASKECAEAYAKGPVPMMKLITKKTKKASVSTRVHYVLAGVKAMGAIDPAHLTQYFDALWSRTPKTEEHLHAEAMQIVFDQLMGVITEQITQSLQSMVGAMRLEHEYEFYSTHDQGEDDFAAPGDPENPPTLH